jgi:hypothetical protein
MNSIKPKILFFFVIFAMVMCQVKAQDLVPFKQALTELEAQNSDVSYINASHRAGAQKGFALETALSKSATDEQLDSLAIYGKLPAERMLAYYTLLWFRKGKYCAKLMPQMLSDEGKVVVAASGDGATTTVNRFVATQSSLKKGLFTDRHIDMIDSMYLSYPDIRTKGYYAEALKRCKGVPKYYRLFCKLYADGDSLMLPYIAVYKRDKDTQKIITAIKEYSIGQAAKPEDEVEIDLDEYGRTNEGLKAVIEWPDPVFMPVLEELGKYMFSRNGYFYIRGQFYFMALMTYDDDWSYKVIERCLKKKKLLQYYSRIFTEAFKFTGRKPRYMPLIEKYGDQQVLNHTVSYDD